MPNTGYQKYTILEEYNLNTLSTTGVVKNNIKGQPDYVTPNYNTTACPLPVVITYNYYNAIKYSCSCDGVALENNVQVKVPAVGIIGEYYTPNSPSGNIYYLTSGSSFGSNTTYIELKNIHSTSCATTPCS